MINYCCSCRGSALTQVAQTCSAHTLDKDTASSSVCSTTAGPEAGLHQCLMLSMNA